MDIRLIPITDHLSLVQGRKNGRFPESHTFLIQDKTSALIDTGCGIDLLRSIRDTYPIDIVINSHAHMDHCAGNWIFDDRPLYAPVQGAESHGRLFELSHRFFESDSLADLWRSWVGKKMGFRDRVPSNFFDEGYVFDFGDLKLRTVHTPGHSADHYCLFEPEERILLSFDIDLTPFGPWFGNPESDLGALRNSFEIVRGLRPKLMATSHSDVLWNYTDKALDAYISILDSREKGLLKLLKGGATRKELVDAAPIYGHYPAVPELLRYFEGRMIDLQLEEMASRSLIEKRGETLFPTRPN